MKLLDPECPSVRDGNPQVRCIPQRPSPFAGKGHGKGAPRLRRHEGPFHIPGVPRRGNAQNHVSRAGVPHDLLGKHEAVIAVVGHRRHEGLLAAEGYGGQGSLELIRQSRAFRAEQGAEEFPLRRRQGALQKEALHELPHDMVTVGTASPVAADKKRTALQKSADQHMGGLEHLIPNRFQAGVFSKKTVNELPGPFVHAFLRERQFS